MTDNEIKKTLLRRLYLGAFEQGVDFAVNLHEFASDFALDRKHILEIFVDLKEENLVRARALRGYINITSDGILYCEKSLIVKEELIQHQIQVRTKLLDTAAIMRKELGAHTYIHYKHLCERAGVKEQDFVNNKQLLIDYGLFEWQAGGCPIITRKGKKQVDDYRRKKSIEEHFEKLKSLSGITKQQRGHELENLIAEIAKIEGWNVELRVRSQGQETDLIMHIGTQYFFVSCKWEKDPISPNEIELIESRVRSRATTNGGLLFSMSGFTDNCIEEARMKISSALIIIFGPEDIENIFQYRTTMQDLLSKKLKQAMSHRKILVDGNAK